MNLSKIAVRYAKALFELAMEHDAIDAVYNDMKIIDRLCSMNEVKEVINNPIIPQKKRKEIIIALAGEGVSELTVRFIEMTFSHGRGDYLAAAARDFIEMTRQHRGIKQVIITTAVPVSNRLKENVAAAIAGNGKGKTEIVEQVDASLIGGFIVRIDDTYIDASVRSRLNKFRKEFSLAGYSEE